MGEYLFITGMGRSGTTLLEKILCNHPQASVLSQPFPLVLVEAKRAFLAGLGCSDVVYPLSHYFMEACRYSTEEVTSFLTRYDLGAEKIHALFEQMKDYSGQAHKPPDLEKRLSRVVGGPFGEVVKRLLYTLRHRDDARLFGSKEMHAEEFWPFFLGCGFKCLGIVRDPRDVIASMIFGRGPQYAGRIRPTLFYVRNWRKSVAFMLHLAEHPGFLWIRYEDLAQQPEAILCRIGAFLNLENLEQTVREPLRDQAGAIWKGNSSFRDYEAIVGASVGGYRQVLPAATRAYIEGCCFPEMQALGYPCPDHPELAEHVLRAYEEPISVTRPEFAPGYSSSPEHVRQEVDRLRVLAQPHRGADAARYVLSPKVHAMLASAVGAASDGKTALR